MSSPTRASLPAPIPPTCPDSERHKLAADEPLRLSSRLSPFVPTWWREACMGESRCGAQERTIKLVVLHVLSGLCRVHAK
ncbi:hypothetical protein PsYK624_054590 [Phanerochaete sordida]|uniref:Uncharacterized protein n=1 Tax=Phanerochaete sordida TaxID=48140 RepID=A0A9P3G7P8_9APHY|nr:hypothetical protein PsYK624_054590 [Phanerochaete sordida]